MIHKEILEDLMRDSPCVKNGLCDDKEGHWCMLRDIIRLGYIKLSDRDAEQLRLMYDYKYMISKKEGIDIGRERAFKEFIEIYGKKFADIYRDGMKHDELFEKVFDFEVTHTDEELRTHIKSSIN